MLLLSVNCSRHANTSSLYDQELTIPGSGGVNISCDKERMGPMPIPLPGSSTLQLNLTGTVLLRYVRGNVPYVVEVKGELQEVDLITKTNVFSVEGNTIKYGEIDDDHKITWKSLLLTESDKKKSRYLAFESQPEGRVLVTVFEFLGFPGVGSMPLPGQIEIPSLGRGNKLEFHKVPVLKASVSEILYHVQKVIFFSHIDSFYREFHNNKIAEQRRVVPEDKREISTKEYVQRFMERYQKEHGGKGNLSDLGRVLDETLMSINSGQSNLTELQEQALKVSSYAFWQCFARYDFGSPIPRLGTEEDTPVIFGNPEVLLNLLYHYWINKNPNIRDLPFKDKLFSIVYPF
jgi:hypothetical protein